MPPLSATQPYVEIGGRKRPAASVAQTPSKRTRNNEPFLLDPELFESSQETNSSQTSVLASSSQSSTTSTPKKNTGSSSGGKKADLRWDGFKTAAGTTAEDVIIEYLVEGTNLTNWKNTDRAGKDRHAQNMMDIMREEGIPIDKDHSAFYHKVTSICSNWTTAHQEYTKTGNGMSDEDALKDPNEEGITHEEQAARLAARHKRASFLAQFSKKYPYYEALKPVLLSRSAYAPKLLLDSNQPDPRTIDQQISITDRDLPRTPTPRRKDMTRSMFDNPYMEGNPEDDPEFQRLFSKDAERDYEGSDTEFEDDEGGLPKANERGRAAAGRGTAPRDETVKIKAEQASRRGKKSAGSDLTAPLTEVLHASNELEEKMWRQTNEQRMADRAAAAEEAQARLQLDRDRLELEDRKMQANAKAEEQRAERELLQAKTASFEAFRKAGFGNVEALKLAGLSVPE